MDPMVTEETLRLAKEASLASATDVMTGNPMAERLLAKGGISTTSAGLVYLNLSPLVGFAYPMPDMLIKELPRVQGAGTATRWNMITDIGTAHLPLGLSEGNRNQDDSITTKAYLATYQDIGRDTYSTMKAQWASRQLTPDTKMAAHLTLLHSARRDEEAMVLGGNFSLALGQVAGVTLSATAADGGTIADTTDLYVRVIALTPEGMRILGGTQNPCAASLALSPRMSRTPNGGTVEYVGGYCGCISANNVKSGAISDGTNTATLSASWTAIQGAAGYAVFWGVDAAANCKIGAVVEINSLKILSATPLGTTAANGTDISTSTDYSYDDGTNHTYQFDGITSLILGKGQGYTPATTGTGLPGVQDTVSGAYVYSMATGTAGTGTYLTSDSATGCKEINAALADRYRKYQLSFDHIWVSYAQALDLRDISLSTGGGAVLRMNADWKDAAAVSAKGLTAGVVVGSYMNPFGAGVGGPANGQLIPITVHPYLAPGTILFTSKRLPYDLPNNENLMEIETLQEWFAMEWPVTRLRWEHGVYASEVLKMRFGPAFGAIVNIGSKYTFYS